MKQIYTGVVEDILDPLKLGRVQVRVFGLHSDDKSLIPTATLPWATVATPTTSASVSGIGSSPTGLLPGSWVILCFHDKDCQYPVIFASYPGIPVDTINQTIAIEETTFGEVDAVAAIPKTTPNNPVTNGEVEKAIDVKLEGARPARDFTSVTSACIDLIKSQEKFSSTAYFDVDSYSIGYGSKTVNGRPVAQGQTITEPEALAELNRYVNATALPEVQKAVRVLVTQSMIDALVSVNYNMGGPKFRRTSILSDLNSGKYLQAAANFSAYTADSNGKVLAGLKTRREKESALFLKDSVPGNGNDIQKTELNPSAIEYDSKGNVSKVNTNKVLSQRGFTDPSGVYPLYRDEPDTNRLARHENIEKTIVYSKEAARLTGVAIANSGASWDQSPVPYNAQYPNNSVYGTKSGHLMEFDDTAGSRRIQMYHAAGTFTEIDDNGTQVNRIVGDGYEILDRNGYVSIRGAQHVNVSGSKSLLVGGTMSIEVIGDTVINTRGDTQLRVSGNLQTSVGGDYLVKVGGTYSVDATKVYHNSGKSASVAAPDSAGESEEATFSELNVITRQTESVMNYETPESGSAEAYNADKLKDGTITKEDLTAEANEVTTTKPTTTNKEVTKGCEDMHSRDDFPTDLVLSKYFKIGDLNKQGTRKIINQVGLTPQDIACNLKTLSINVLDIIKEMYPNMIITSGFRRPGDVANSAKNSDHYYGRAADIQLPGFTRKQYYDAITAIQAKVPYDQLILEYSGATTTWIHISLKSAGNRAQLFTMHNHKRISEFGEFKLIA
jgi:GH24 family phage-related lysozyme (muramidase)/uncharacterized protein YcbK (DUF882 family)